MGQTTSAPSRGRRRSLRTFRSPFPRRTTSHQSNLSATFTITDSDQKIEQLNVNVASEEELMTLPGITRTIAQSIVEYRRKIGRFKKVEDLALVSGVGADKLDKIRPEICVSKRSCTSSRAQSMDSLKSADSSKVGLKSLHCLKLVDVNKATVFDLQSIHGLSQELAANIIHYRDKKGLFKSLDGLLKVKGVDAIRLSSIRCQLTVNSEPENDQKQKNGLITSTPNNSNTSDNNPVPNPHSVHTPKHRKSLSAPMKISLSLGNGLSKAPLNDIFDLLSAYSYRPIVEEDFKYERNGEKAIRIATWNLDRLCLQKAENLGFREVVCRTILENRFSVLAIQDIYDISALKLLCDELNKPSLRRISEWKDNSHNWNYCLSDIHCMLSHNSPGVGFIYDSSACPGAEIEFVSIQELRTHDGGELQKSNVAVAKFAVGDIAIVIMNGYLNQIDFQQICKSFKEFGNKDDVFLVVGDFTEFCKHIEDLTSSFDLLNIIPFTTNTSFMSISPHYNRYSNTCYLSGAARYYDNLLLGGASKLQYTGVAGVIRQGLTHMAIPRGWSWGGPASEHCPVWCEVYVKKIKGKMEGIAAAGNIKNEIAMMNNGACGKVISERTITSEIKPLMKQNNNSTAITNGSCVLEGI